MINGNENETEYERWIKNIRHRQTLGVDMDTNILKYQKCYMRI